MFKYPGRKIFTGLAVGALLSALVTTPVWAEDKGRGYVLDSSGNPVTSAGGCVVAPNQPAKSFDKCDGKVASGDDSDGDGVPDNQDKCPNTPKGVKVDASGCPLDSDGDGVPDYLDNCPNNTALEISKGVDASGCPLDSDGDGVPDYRDNCPNTPADLIHKVDANGCEPTEKVVRATVNSVFFDFDKSNLKADGRQLLDSLAEEVKKEDAYVRKIDVTGHTDSIGTDAYNQKLSERRANTTAEYLRSKGVPSSKMEVKGMGEKAPIADNKTDAGRAQNRRVVVDIHMTK